MAVAFDAASAVQTFNSVSSKSWSHTASGSNRYVRVSVAWAKLGTTTASVTYGGTSMTSVGVSTNTNFSSTVTGKAQIFELINPPTGAQTVVVTFSAGGNLGAAGSVSYTGVHQTTASGTAVTETSNLASATTLAISSNTGDMVSDCVIADGPTGLIAGQTERFKGSGTGGSDYWGGGQDAAGASSININWSFTGGTTTAYGHVAANILQAGGATLGATITTPTSSPTYNNGNTSTITIGGTTSAATSVTWTNDRGGSGSATNTGTSYSTWSITGITLSLGANVITVTAGDGSTTVTDTITVTYTAAAENCRGFGTTFGSATSDNIVSALTSFASQRSYAFWVYFNGLGGGSAGRIFDKVNNVIYSDTTDTIVLRQVFSGATAEWFISGTGTGAWHHVVITYDNSSNSNDPIMYLDGVSQTVTEAVAPSGTVTTGTNAFNIGNRADGARNFDGLLSEFAVWNRILNGTEAAGLGQPSGGYNGKSPLYYPTSLVEYIPLNDSPVTSKVLANPTVTGTAQQTGLAIDFPTIAGSLTATFTDSLAGGELI